MKSPRRFTSFIAITAVILSINPTFISIAQSAGRSPSAVVNTILNGKGVPKPSLGIDGDFYIDTRSLLLYGPKKKGKWPTPQNLQGPTGPAGSDGKNGSDGRAGISNVSSVTGAQGPAGPQGEKGEKGDPGAPGASGPAGAPGPSGPAGANGANGAQGPAGPAGANGATGATGAQGPKGETGTAGLLQIEYGNLTFSDLSGGPGSSQFASLNIFSARKSYLVRISIVTYQPNDGTEFYMPISLTVTSTIPGINPQTRYLLAHGYSYRTGANRYENSIEAEVILDGHLIDEAYGINVTVSAGRTTEGIELLKISGMYSAQVVENLINHA
jgi:hypothetical protein